MCKLCTHAWPWQSITKAAWRQQQSISKQRQQQSISKQRRSQQKQYRAAGVQQCKQRQVGAARSWRREAAAAVARGGRGWSVGSAGCDWRGRTTGRPGRGARSRRQRRDVAGGAVREPSSPPWRPMHRAGMGLQRQIDNGARGIGRSSSLRCRW